MGDSASVRLLLFRVGDLNCAVPLEMAREVLPILPATRIPGAPISVNGLVNVRGSLLTVVDGRRLLDRPGDVGWNEEASVIVLDLNGKLIGLEVDQVLDLLDVAPDRLESRGALPGIDQRLVRAVGREADRLFILLDTDALLAPVLTN